MGGATVESSETACVFAWEERAEASSRFMREEMRRYVGKYWQ